MEDTPRGDSGDVCSSVVSATLSQCHSEHSTQCGFPSLSAPSVQWRVRPDGVTPFQVPQLWAL